MDFYNEASQIFIIVSLCWLPGLPQSHSNCRHITHTHVSSPCLHTHTHIFAHTITFLASRNILSEVLIKPIKSPQAGY